MSDETLEKKLSQNSGKFIILEGPEGAGKSTAVTIISAYLSELNYKHITTREPGGTPLGDTLRSILLDRNTGDLDPITELQLLIASRSDSYNHIVKSNLEKGLTVITDRSYHSSIAYQGFARGLGPENVINANKLALHDIVPDLVVIFNIPAKMGLERAGRRGALELDRIESAGLNFHERVRSGYLSLKELLPHEPIVYIDSSGAPEETMRQVWPHIQKLLNVPGDPYHLYKNNVPGNS